MDRNFNATFAPIVGKTLPNSQWTVLRALLTSQSMLICDFLCVRFWPIPNTIWSNQPVHAADPRKWTLLFNVSKNVTGKGDAFLSSPHEFVAGRRIEFVGSPVLKVGLFLEYLLAFVRGGAAALNRLLCRRLFEQREFLSHLIQGGGGGTPMGTHTGGNGFGSFCRNKRTSSAGAKLCY